MEFEDSKSRQHNSYLHVNYIHIFCPFADFHTMNDRLNILYYDDFPMSSSEGEYCVNYENCFSAIS